MIKTITVLFLTLVASIAYSSNINELLDKNSTVILKDHLERTIISINSDKILIPASTLKILTALSAIDSLGSDYRFKTDFYMNERFDLIIKGYGDPVLISEIIESVSEKIAKKINKYKVKDIILDGSFFKKNITIPGVIKNSSQPYDAPNGAICSNFNTVFFEKNKTGKFISGEKQTPLLDFTLKRVKDTKLDKGRVKLNSNDSLLYTGHLFKYFLQKKGLKIDGSVKRGVLNNKANKIYEYNSVYTLNDVIKKLMLFSNNFIANQVFITMGAEKKGVPGDLKKGMEVVSNYLKKTNKKHLSLVEGSGISRNNKISSADLMTILLDFKIHYKLLKNEGNDFFKTGTMRDISSRVGFIKKNNKLYSYVIIINGDNAYLRLNKIYKQMKKLIK
ncbi:MAG: D-alanyl-D-alanine carboxypeptidase [Desulfobacterales bacterium]|nr:D-alanyl-D-alanine carboxypeptidase [Desulfobacterales bacterium]